jgi:hypothetical protein
MRFLRLRGQTVVNELSIIKAYSEEKLKQGTKQGALVRVFYFFTILPQCLPKFRAQKAGATRHLIVCINCTADN